MNRDLPLAFFALIAVVAEAPAAASADTLGVLALADPPGPDAALARLTGELRSALAARAPDVLLAASLRERMASRAPPASLAELDRAYSGALAAHADGDWEGANRTLRAVVEAIEGLPEGPPVFAAWTRAMLRLARSEQELGRGVEAQAILARLLRAAPEARPDARQYPPSFHALVEEGRARLSALGTAALTVESHPPARVFVDGREIGTSPVTVLLAPGRYRVSGLSGGMASPTLVLDVSGDRSVELDLSLAEALRPEAGPGLALPREERPARAIAAAARLGLDRVVLATLSRAAGELRFDAGLHDVRRGQVERSGSILLQSGAPSPSAMEALAAWLVEGRASALVATPLGPSLTLAAVPPVRAPGPLAESRLESRASSPLGWFALGTGIAAIAAGGIAVVYGNEASARYADARGMLDGSGRVTLPNTVATYNDMVRAGDLQRTRGTALGIAAGAGLVTSIALSYLSWRQTGEVGPFRFSMGPH